MKEFIQAALPWVLMGIAMAVAAVTLSGRKKKAGSGEKNSYAGEGMAVGMCLGVAMGSSGVMELSMGLSLGMLLGLVIGMSMEKKDQKGGKE